MEGQWVVGSGVREWRRERRVTWVGGSDGFTYFRPSNDGLPNEQGWVAAAVMAGWMGGWIGEVIVDTEIELM